MSTTTLKSNTSTTTLKSNMSKTTGDHFFATGQTTTGHSHGRRASFARQLSILTVSADTYVLFHVRCDCAAATAASKITQDSAAIISTSLRFSNDQSVKRMNH